MSRKTWRSREPGWYVTNSWLQYHDLGDSNKPLPALCSRMKETCRAWLHRLTTGFSKHWSGLLLHLQPSSRLLLHLNTLPPGHAPCSPFTRPAAVQLFVPVLSFPSLSSAMLVHHVHWAYPALPQRPQAASPPHLPLSFFYLLGFLLLKKSDSASQLPHI